MQREHAVLPQHEQMIQWWKCFSGTFFPHWFLLYKIWKSKQKHYWVASQPAGIARQVICDWIEWTRSNRCVGRKKERDKTGMQDQTVIYRKVAYLFGLPTFWLTALALLERDLRLTEIEGGGRRPEPTTVLTALNLTSVIILPGRLSTLQQWYLNTPSSETPADNDDHTHRFHQW